MAPDTGARGNSARGIQRDACGTSGWRSVTANTREDGRELLALAAEIPIRTRTRSYALADANRALADLKHDRVSGAAVLDLRGAS